MVWFGLVDFPFLWNYLQFTGVKLGEIRKIMAAMECVSVVPPQFQPPRKREMGDPSKKRTKARSKFGQNAKGIDVVVLRDTGGTLERSPQTPTSPEPSNDVIASEVASCSSSTDNCLTMTGTIRRGKKSVESIDVKLQLSREELDRLEASITVKSLPDDDDCFFGLSKGLHVFVLSLFCLPFVVVASSGYSFYFGTVTWYNILVYISEERTILHKVFLSPLLILFFPFYIISATLGLGIYSAAIQVSWYYDSWKIEIQDFEKGFYGWMCLQLGLVSCAPYEVVVLEKNVENHLLGPSVSKSNNKISDTVL